jgi:hypothetical protein
VLSALVLSAIGCAAEGRESKPSGRAALPKAVAIEAVSERAPGAAAEGLADAVATVATARTADLDERTGAADARRAPRARHTPLPHARPTEPAWDMPWKECTGVHVYIVSYSPRYPEHSVASISTGSRGRAYAVHPGQWLGEWEVLAITDDWSGLRPAVWLRHGAETCRARLSGNPERVPPAEPVRKHRRKVRRKRARR